MSTESGDAGYVSSQLAAARDANRQLKTEVTEANARADKANVRADEAEAKTNEFRENNRSLSKQKGELETKLKAFDGIDPDAARAALERPAVDPRLTEAEARAATLTAELTAATTALEDMKVRSTVVSEFISLGGRPEASDFLVQKYKAAFFGPDGQPIEAFSPSRPGEPLNLKTWMEEQLATSAFAFLPSRGGGAIPGLSTGAGSGPRTVSGAEFGANIADIASGAAIVR